MRRPLELWLTDRWYGGVEPGLGLRSLAGIYRVLRGLRPGPPEQHLPVPVIVVGNFTAGGTGKTPLVIALARHFSALGMRPGIISRGHGRVGDEALRVDEDTMVAASGDEPRLMFEEAGVPVFVDRNRVAAARAALAEGCTLVIADDGLQHQALGRDVEIEVVDGARRYGNGLLLPAGPLRERPRPCDFRVVNGGIAATGEWAMRLQLGDAVSLQDRSLRRPLSSFLATSVQGVAGIGNPARFFGALRGVGLDVVGHAFADHHRFRAEDFAGIPGPILMTGKDAVKCRGLGLRDAWVVGAQAELAPEFLAAVDRKLKEADGQS